MFAEQTVITITRKGRSMPSWHNPKPTTNIASGWRAAQRDVKKEVRVEKAQDQRDQPKGKRDER